MKKDTNDIHVGKGNGYIADGKTCMIRCFKCGKENYALNVSSGFCTWCGYNPNTKGKKK